MSYTVIISRSVQKQLAKLSAEIQERIVESLAKLENNPSPSGSKKLKGRDGWRIRIGDYRVIYEINDQVLQVIVIHTGHRRDVYRDS